jgi:hypothetical protein
MGQAMKADSRRTLAFAALRAPLLAGLLFAVAASVGVLAPRAARADAVAPSQRPPRHRTCCALASNLPLHLGASHVPVAMGIVIAPASLGPHSYAGDGTTRETNGILYTRRGGFIDTGHTREYADLTARLIVQLGPLLARGEGALRLESRDGEVMVRVKSRVPPDELASTTARLAGRIAFQISVWVEITQHYGHTVMRGAEENFSAFTPEDLYSNLLGAHLGAAAAASELPYDRAMDALFVEALASLGATSAGETRRILDALDGRWWRSGTPWPAATIPILRSFDIGPRVGPVLAPADVAAPASPLTLDVPSEDDHGDALTDLYRLEIVPDLGAIPRFVRAGSFPVVTGDDLPRLVATVRRAIAAGDDTSAPELPSPYGDEHHGPIPHYLVGLRLLDLKVAGGLAAPLDGAPKGVLGGSVVALRGDTRGGDFALLRFDASHTARRGLIAGLSLFRSDALFFCHDPETRRLRAPLLSLLGPCAGGEWFGLGGSVAEAFHDGRTGRTAIRPVATYGVLDVLGNGQSPSYDGLRLLLRGGGAVEHVWTQTEGGVTIPRAGGNAVVLARTPGRTFELHGGAGYRLDPTTPRDAAFESNLTLRWYFVLGGARAAPLADAVDPWGVGSLGLEGAYSFWTRPAHSFADTTAPFVSADRSGTWQLLVTTTLGFEGLTF